MRVRPTVLALGIAFAALSAQAQTAPQPAHPAQEGPFSVFVYERLGATPALQRPPVARDVRAAQPRAGGEGEAQGAVQLSKTNAAATRRAN